MDRDVAAGSAGDEPGPRVLRARWLGRIPYREAWVLQRELAAARAAGSLVDDQVLLLEHGPVLTLGRNARADHVLAPEALLRKRGIEVVQVERGGEVTYHGPGQLVAYPIVALATPGSRAVAAGWDRAPVGVRSFVDALEAAMADAAAAFGVAAGPRPGHPGCWVVGSGARPRKIGAIGIRVARGVSFHGIALNVTTDLRDFELIDPCGMPGLESSSIAHERGLRDAPPTTSSVAEAAVPFARALAHRLGARLTGALPPDADPEHELVELARLAGVAVGSTAGRA